MQSTVSEVSNILGNSITHTKSILKNLYTEEEISRSTTGSKIFINPNQIKKIMEHENKYYEKRIASISQQKGGVGKTTLTINFAVKASLKGVKVLVVDTDPESNASSFFLDEEIFQTSEVYTIKEILKKQVEPRDAIRKTRYEFVDIIPCRGASRKAERELEGKNLGNVVRQILQPLLNDYDLILIDQGPSFNALNVSCYLACDIVLMPVDSSGFAIEGIALTIGDIIEEAREFDCTIPELKIIKNTVSTHKKSGKDATEAIDQNFKEYLTDIVIPEATLFTHCTNNGITVFETKAALLKHKSPFEKIFSQIMKISNNVDVQ